MIAAVSLTIGGLGCMWLSAIFYQIGADPFSVVVMGWTGGMLHGTALSAAMWAWRRPPQ